MGEKSIFNFEYSYLSLPNSLYSLVNSSTLSNAEILINNCDLAKQLTLNLPNNNELITTFRKVAQQPENKSFAQAYAGHQFGYFNKLGDGRAIILGEHITKNNQRYDVQIKGSGPTPYSRGGDGKATLKAMLREYLMSEAMYYLNIPTSRSLTVLKTGELVFRGSVHAGAVLIRIMQSHIRVGTFEYAAYLGSKNDLVALTNYTIERLFPEISDVENPALDLLYRVMESQIELVVNWMRVGFIHGVMNTDNTAISGETFDYGPCAFLNTYNPETVYSSIDKNGRYAFGNQSKMIKWNLTRFAEALLPVIHTDEKIAIKLAQHVINKFDALWEDKYYTMMLHKIGIAENKPQNYSLIDSLLHIMTTEKMDYTNTFLKLSQGTFSKNNNQPTSNFENWIEQWKSIIEKTAGMDETKKLMQRNNPVIIPRNHLVEQALDEAVKDDFTLYNKLLKKLSTPYAYQNDADQFMNPPNEHFDKTYQTFCGT